MKYKIIYLKIKIDISKEMKFIFTVLSFLFLYYCSVNVSYGQDSEKPDLRDSSCLICRGNAQNFSILNVYFSDAEGNPKNICDDSEDNFISILYSSNSKSGVHNLRIIADILEKDKTKPNADPEFFYYINEFIGSVEACPGTCTIKIPIPKDIKFQCATEFYELSKPLVSWTSSSSKNLEKEYDCGDYPPAQCLNNPNSIIEEGELSYSFEPIFECVREDINQIKISFILTSLFGGNPTQKYDIKWKFIFQNETTVEFEVFDPTLGNITAGTEFKAELKITQGNSIGDPVTKDIKVPDALSSEDVMEGVPNISDSEIEEETGKDLERGSIEVKFRDREGLFYYWTSLDDPSFYSEEARIDDLPAGTYMLTTFDFSTGTCRIDEFDIGAFGLPVQLSKFNVDFLNQSRRVKVSWATTKEWENSGFDIERSEQNIKNFKKIGQVKGMGWSDTVIEYAFEDKNLPISGGMVYYRLKQVDFDGKFEYSRVLPVNLPKLDFTQGVWRAYPNPTNGEQLRIGLLERNEYNGERLTFRIIQTTSVSEPISVSDEAEMNEILSTMIPKISKGLFIVEIRWGQKVEHIKVLRK
jgi:hypothetical protein